MTPDTAIAESVGFCAFFGHTMQNLSQILCLLLDSSANLTLFLCQGQNVSHFVNDPQPRFYHAELGTTNQF